MNNIKESRPSLIKTLVKLKEKYPNDADIQNLAKELMPQDLPDLGSIIKSIPNYYYNDLAINNLPNIDIYLIDKDLRFLFVAGKEKERFSLDSNYFLGKTLFDVLQDETREKLLPIYKAIFKGKASQEQLQYQDESYDITTRPIYNERKEIIAGLIILHNITKVKSIEKRLIKAKEKAENAEKTNSLFLATMSHEIRTPLNTIIGFASRLEKSILNESQEKYLANIQSSSEHLLNVVNDLLILFKIGYGKVFVDHVPFQVRPVIKDIAGLFETETKNKNLKLKLRISKEANSMVVGDPYRLKQILINVIGNAVKFTEEGHVSINCSVKSIENSTLVYKIEVSDSGIGIPEDDLEKVFYEFTQADNILKKKRQGSGLGLTISKKLIELMNGDISVESKLDKGTKFILTIPFQKADASSLAPKPGRYNMTEKQLEGKKILVADDDEYNLLLTEAIFKDWGMEYDFASTGIEALQKSEARKYDILLFDIHMPGMTGQNLVRKIRMDNKNPNNDGHILTMTANILKSDLKGYLLDGFDDFILKPYKEEELYNKLCNALSIPVLRKNGNNKKQDSIDNSRSLIDLTELTKTAKGDKEFERKMIDSFIENTETSLIKMKKALQTGSFRTLGEVAHKMLSSFRYFNISQIVKNLEEIEEKCLYGGNSLETGNVANSTIQSIESLLQGLKNKYCK